MSNQVCIHGKMFSFYDNALSQPASRNAFFYLAEKVFGLHLQKWYDTGLDTEKYVPLLLTDNDRPVSNVSFSILEFDFRGEKKLFAQIGTVMSHPDYRNIGLNSFLMHTALEKTKNLDGTFLFSNAECVGYYKKFGFVPGSEFHTRNIPVSHLKPAFRLADINSPSDLEALRHAYSAGNPYSLLKMKNNFGLVLFHLRSGQFSFYLGNNDETAVITRTNDSLLRLSAVYGKYCGNLKDICSALPDTSQTAFSTDFTPIDQSLPLCPSSDNNSVLMLLKGYLYPMRSSKCAFPLLSVT